MDTYGFFHLDIRPTNTQKFQLQGWKNSITWPYHTPSLVLLRRIPIIRSPQTTRPRDLSVTDLRPKILVGLCTIPDFGLGSRVFEDIWSRFSWSDFVKCIQYRFESVPDASIFDGPGSALDFSNFHDDRSWVVDPCSLLSQQYSIYRSYPEISCCDFQLVKSLR